MTEEMTEKLSPSEWAEKNLPPFAPDGTPRRRMELSVFEKAMLDWATSENIKFIMLPIGFSSRYLDEVDHWTDRLRLEGDDPEGDGHLPNVIGKSYKVRRSLTTGEP